MATNDRTNDRPILTTGGGEPLADAFDKINENFDDLFGIASNFSAVNRNIIPDATETYDIGNAVSRFRDIYLSGNTIHLGNKNISVNEQGELEFGGTKIPTQTDLDTTIAATSSGPLTGTLTGDVYASDSTLLVDAQNGKIVGPVEANVTGNINASLVEATTITAQGGTSNDTGGSVNLVGANGASQGGGVTVAGAIGVSGDGGNVNIAGGIGSSGDGGVVSFVGGTGTIAGGNAIIAGGAGDTNGGNVFINAGPSAGTDGKIFVNGDVTFVNNKTIDFTNANVTGLDFTLDGELKGSVFADDSTLLVDGVAGKIVGPIDTAQQARFTDSILLQNGNDLVSIGDEIGASFQLPNKGVSFLGGGVDGGNYNVGFTSNGSGSILTSNQLNIISGAGMTINTANGLSIFNTVNVDAAVTAPSFVGDLTGSVFADDSTLLVDGVNGIIPASVISGTITNAIDTSSVTKTNGTLSVTAVGGNLELRAPFNNVVLSSFADISLTSNYIQMSAGTDTEVYADANVKIKAPTISIGTTEDDSTIAIGQHNINNTTTTNFYGDYVFYNRSVEFNGSDITFGNSTETPTINFTNATVSGWSDPNVVNKANDSSQKIVVGSNTAVMDFLTVRVAENTPGELDVEFNYDAGGTVSVSANGDLPNRFNGETIFTAGNTTWTVMNVLTTVGDKGEFTIVDHSGHKIYRVTTFAGEMPGIPPGEAYCVIERLK